MKSGVRVQNEMRRTRVFGVVILLVGLAYGGFWTAADMDVNEGRKHAAMQMPKEQFTREFPALKLAFRFLGFDPYRPPAHDRQFSEGSLAIVGVKRHKWLGYAILCLGAALTTFGYRTWPTMTLHYVCMIGCGGALFMAATLHPVIMFWNGK
jgi:hypothetical protein